MLLQSIQWHASKSHQGISEKEWRGSNWGICYLYQRYCPFSFLTIPNKLFPWKSVGISPKILKSITGSAPGFIQANYLVFGRSWLTHILSHVIPIVKTSFCFENDLPLHNKEYRTYQDGAVWESRCQVIQTLWLFVFTCLKSEFCAGANIMVDKSTVFNISMTFYRVAPPPNTPPFGVRIDFWDATTNSYPTNSSIFFYQTGTKVSSLIFHIHDSQNNGHQWYSLLHGKRENTSEILFFCYHHNILQRKPFKTEHIDRAK